MTHNASEADKLIKDTEEIIELYKNKIQNTTNYSFLQGMIQVGLGFTELDNTDFMHTDTLYINYVKTTDDINYRIPHNHLVILHENEDLISTIVAQNMAIGQTRSDFISKTDKKFLSTNDLDVSIGDVKNKIETFSLGEIEDATIRYRKSVYSKKQLTELKNKEALEKTKKNRFRL